MKRKNKERKDSDSKEDENLKKIRVEDEVHEEEMEEDGEPSEDETIDFDVKSFRQSLKSEKYFDELKNFIKQSSKHPSILAEFIKIGKPLEFVDLMKKHEGANVEIVSVLCQCLYQVVLFVDVNESANLTNFAAPALKYLVNKNFSSINKMISSKANDKILIFKLLTLALKVDIDLGHDMMKNLEIFSRTNESQEHPLFITNTGKQVSQNCPVRRSIIDFFITLIVNEKGSILRKKILNKRQFFEFILRDIHRDSYDTIKLILTSLTKFVLASPEFSKPEKMKVFSETAVKSLIKLYEWKLNDDQKEHVCTIVHQFLLLLLTSRKHGIVIRALNENRHNQRQLQVVNMFRNVWNFEYPSMLVIEIVRSCPELLQNVQNRLVMGLQPKPTPGWFMCATFTKHLLTALDPVEMMGHIGSSEAKKISSNIIKFSISQFLLQNLNERALIQQESLEIREMSLQILFLMLDHCSKYLKEVNNLSNLKDFEKHRIRFDIINHIFTYFPNVDVILNSLYRSISKSQRITTDEIKTIVKSQLTITLDIILLLTNHFPSAIEKIPSVIDFLSFLKPIIELKFSDEDEQKDENLEIEMKIAKIILLLQPNLLTLDSEMFPRMFTTLIKIFCETTNADLKRDAELTLIGMLHGTTIFTESNNLEIQIWLESFKHVKKGSLKEASALFVGTLRSMKQKGDDCMQIESKSDEKCNYELLSLIDREETLGETRVELSPVLLELLKGKSNKVNRVIEFLEFAVIHIYHCFSQHKKVIMEHIDSELCTNVGGYLKSKKIIDFSEFMVGGQKVYSELYESIAAGKAVKIRTEDIQQLQLLIIQSIFYANQLAEKESLDKVNSGLLGDLIAELYAKLRKIEANSAEEASSFTDEGESDKKVNKIFELSAEKPSRTIMNYIFQHEKLFTSFSVKQFNQMSEFVARLIAVTQSNPEFDKATRRYKVKILTEIEEVLESGKLDEKACKVIENFSFNFDDHFNLLTVLVKKKCAVDKTFLGLLLHTLNTLTKLKMTPLTDEMLRKLEDIYLKASTNAFIEMAEFDQALLDYLTTFPQINDCFSTRMFELACDAEWIPSKSFIRLLTKIFSLTRAWNAKFREHLSSLKKEALYPLLPTAIQKRIVTPEQLKQIYQDCKSGILKAIEKPTKAAQIYRENVETSLKLIELVMPLNECNDLTMKKYKFDSTQLFQLRMLQEIATKAFNVKKETKIHDKFISVWMKLFSLADENDVDGYLSVLESWIRMKPDDHQSELEQGESWDVFVRICLKNGLRTADKSKMLLTLGKFVRSANITDDEITRLFDMILTHSNFFAIVFNFKKSGRLLKSNLFYLLNILVMKNPSVAQEKHVPILLSSYQATLSPSDQLILNLLSFYELRCGIDFHKFRPFLHGPLALSFYTSNDDSKLRLVDKEAEDENVMIGKLLNTFENSLLEKTMNNYPVERSMKSTSVAIEHIDELLNEASDCDVYDPCYFLPLFGMIVSSTSFGFTGYAVTNHLMSIIMPALSCHDERLRLIAGYVLLRCRESTEMKKKQKVDGNIWIRFYDALQKGLKEIAGPTDENDVPKNFPRASSISTHMLAKFSLILPDSLHAIYTPLSNYLAVRESFDFSTIPEVPLFLQSSEMQHEEYRLFLLNTMLNGIRDELDIKLINNTYIMRNILFCYGSTLSSRKTDLVILQIINRILVKSKKSGFLFNNHGLILWMTQAAIKVEAFEYDLIETMLSIIENMEDVMRREHRNSQELLQILLILLRKLSKGRITSQGFLSFLKTFNQTRRASTKLSRDDIDLVHEFIQVFVSIDQIKSINTLEKSTDVSLDNVTKMILLETKNFVAKASTAK